MHHEAGISLLLTHATGYRRAFVVRCSAEAEDNVHSPVASTVSLILAKILAILKIYIMSLSQIFRAILIIHSRQFSPSLMRHGENCARPQQYEHSADCESRHYF